MRKNVRTIKGVKSLWKLKQGACPRNENGGKAMKAPFHSERNANYENK